MHNSTVTVIRPRSREGYVDHRVRTEIRTVPVSDATTPSPHAQPTAAPPVDFAPRVDCGSVASKNWVDRKKAARNPELSPQEQMRLARDPHAEVRIALARNTNHPNVEQVLALDRELRVRQALCETDDVSRLRWLAQDAACQVRITVAHLTDDVPLLTELADDRNPEVRTAARWSLAGGPFEGSPNCFVCYTQAATVRGSDLRYRCADHA